MSALIAMPSELDLTIDRIRWTKSEQEVIDTLRDGQRHDIGEFYGFTDEPTDRRNIFVRVSVVRRKLKGTGLFVLCEYYKYRTYYRLVRLISDEE